MKKKLPKTVLSKEDLLDFLNLSGLVYKAPFTEDDLLEAMNYAFKLGLSEKTNPEPKNEPVYLSDKHLNEIVQTIENSMTGYNISGTINGCVTNKEIPKIVLKLKEIKFNH